jgi:hypothetical protein
LTGDGVIEGAASLGGSWRVMRGRIDRTETGAKAAGGDALAILDPGAASGLIHTIVQTGDATAAAGLVWRVQDEANFLCLKVSGEGCSLIRVEKGTEIPVANDAERHLRPNATHSIQILDAHDQVGCYLDGERLFDAWFHERSFDDATGVGIWLGGKGGMHTRDFEAHPREVPMPAAIRFDAPWNRLGTRTIIADNFIGPPGDLAGRMPARGEGMWEKTLGVGCIEIDGTSGARVRATAEKPNPGRTLYTVPWCRRDFADLEVTITAPGSGRGQKHYCRCGLTFWQDKDNYLCFTGYVDDDYNGSSIALFTKRHGFEELYDAIWTMLWDKINWGKSFRLRVACDGNHFIVFVDDEPVMQRALTDLYPDDPALRITRVGLAISWEWGNDTGSRFEAFTARC